jgi:tRNA(Ile)-lysidine synthase
VGPTPAVAAVRHAVRSDIAGLPAGSTVLAACSGGADSLALAAALAFEAPRAGRSLRAGGVTVDHGLQPGSAQRAESVGRQLKELGLDLVECVAVEVGGDGGPEAAARAARYAALDAIAERTGAAAVLLGHTLDDQAETVLLGLARGSGTRSLAGMAGVSGPGGRYRRPLLGLTRAITAAACADLGLPVWDDPHNADRSFARVRVRSSVLPVLEAELGPGVAEALARTAQLARADADALDDWAARAFAELAAGPPEAGLDVAELAALPTAVRTRVLRQAALAAGAVPSALAAVHILAIDALIIGWSGQGPVNLPGGVTASRRCGRLHFAPVSAGATNARSE